MGKVRNTGVGMSHEDITKTMALQRHWKVGGLGKADGWDPRK